MAQLSVHWNPWTARNGWSTSLTNGWRRFNAWWKRAGPWVSRRALFRMAKSRWEIENQGFNEAKNRYGLQHICHHERNSVLVVWLLTCLALTIERPCASLNGT